MMAWTFAQSLADDAVALIDDALGTRARLVAPATQALSADVPRRSRRLRRVA
jgi:hypothetical protein